MKFISRYLSQTVSVNYHKIFLFLAEDSGLLWLTIWSASLIFLVLVLYELGYSTQLDITCAFINCSNLTVAVELLLWEIFGEAHATHPVDALARYVVGNF